jgi:hypothetical protein
MTPELIVSTGGDKEFPQFPGVAVEDWPVSKPAGMSLDSQRQARDDMEKRVKALVSTFR